MLDHGTSIVIGETAVVGKNCSFLHGVALGSTGTTTFNAVGSGAKFVFSDNVELTQTVTTEVVVSDTTVTMVINGTTYKLLAKA
jgi:serine O-acetyltransferase